MMTSIVNRIDEWITRVKAYGALKAFEFIPGYPAHKTPSPVTKYTVAVTESEEKTDTFVYYYDIYRYYFEDGKRTLDEAGIKVPYQQMDVHLQKD